MALLLFLEVLKIDRNEVTSLNDWIESQEAARPCEQFANGRVTKQQIKAQRRNNIVANIAKR